jgi:uncharacterized protein
MISRNIVKSLEAWGTKERRKPLVLRGIRQVGKTTVVNDFGKQFEIYISLNLELPIDRKAFDEFETMSKLVETIFFTKNKSYSNKKKTLLFIDEIQEVPEAINLLRYFYEQYPDIYVIAAGSLLETLFDNKNSFPVGRVEYMILRPVSFSEFLSSLDEEAALTQFHSLPIKDFAHDKLISLFRTYAIIGGMPEIVFDYIKRRDLTALKPMYESLIKSYLDDVEKYARNETQLHIIRHAIKSSFLEAGKRIKFSNFGHSNYGSREMGEALRTLEKALLISLMYPTNQSVLPIVPQLKKSPRLQLVDTGLMNFYLGIQKDVLASKDLHSVYEGGMIEHLVGQELIANEYSAISSLNFWTREKKTSQAELDYVIQYEGKLIPIEVKSGATGTLKSLHLFMDQATHPFAVRIYAGKLSVSQVTTQAGTVFHLLNLPYYLSSKVNDYLEWFEGEVGKK